MHTVAYGREAGMSTAMQGAEICHACRLGLCVMVYVCTPYPQTYVKFWPTQGEAAYGRFHVHLISEESAAGFASWTLGVTNRQQVGSLHRDGKVL